MTFTSYFIYVAKVLNNAHYLDRDLNMKRFESRLNGSSVPATINSTIIDHEGHVEEEGAPTTHPIIELGTTKVG
jgi:hypothetical protein